MNLFAMLLLTAAAAYGVARWLKVPSLPLLIAFGMALNLAGLVPADQPPFPPPPVRPTALSTAFTPNANS